MSDNAVSNTVLISAFGTSILVCIIYFVHAHLIPHLKRSEVGTQERADSSLPHGLLPQWQVRPDPRLREILYNSPTPNYLDPRNSVAGSDLKRSRWSTNIQDLSDLSPMKSTPRSAKRHIRQFSLLDVPLTPDRRLPAPSLYSHTTHRSRTTMKREILDQEGMRTRRIRPVSTIAVVAGGTHGFKTEHPIRPRSRSAPQLVTSKSLLVRSHTSPYAGSFTVDPQSPIFSALSETTLQSVLTPSDDSRDSSRTNSACLPCQLQSYSVAHQ